MLTLFLLIPLLGATVVGFGYFLTRSPGREFRERWKAAANALSAGKYAEARLILTRLVEEDPRRLQLRQQLTFCLLKLNRPADAAVVARGSLEIDPAFAPAHSLLSVALKALGDPEGAIREAELAIAGHKVAEDARRVLAELLIDVGLESRGIEVLVQLLELDRGNEEAALRLATLMAGREIKSTVASGKARRSLKQHLGRLRERLKEDPADPEVVGAVARLALAAGEPTIASSALIAIKVHRELSDTETVLLARALAASGHTDRARTLLNGLPPITPDEVPPDQLPPEERRAAAEALGEFQARVVARIETGDCALALADLDRLSPQVASTLPLLKLRLVALLRLAHPGADLEATATAILARQPLDERSRVSRAMALLARGRPDAALADAILLERHSPGLDDGAWLHGLAALELGFAQSALDLLLKAEPDPVDPVSARWIVKAAIFARDDEHVARLLPVMAREGNGALRSMAALVAGDADRAQEIASGEHFASSPVSERVQAAGLLSGVGRDATSETLLRFLKEESVPASGSLKANILLFLGREEEASSALRTAADEGGRDALGALLALAERAAVHGEEGKAEHEALLVEIRAHPDGALQALLHEGGMALVRGDLEEALEKARQVLSMMSANPSARALKFEALLGLNAAPEDVEAAADQVLEVAPGFAPARTVRAMALVREGRKNLLSGDAGSATDQLNEAVSLAPGAAGARLLRGMALLGGGDLRTVEEDARLLKNSDDGKFAGHFLEGLLHSNRGEPNAAADSFKSALEIQPDVVDAVAALGLALLKAGRTEEALEQADHLATLEAGVSLSLKIRASGLAARNDLAEAERSLRNAVARDETDLGARLLLSRVLVLKEQKEEALEVLRSAVEARPGAAAAHSQLVQLLVRTGDHEGALRAAGAAGKIEGLRALSHILRFYCLKHAGRRAEGIEELRLAIRIEPENPIALEFLGELSLKDGDTVAGHRLLLRAASASPRNLRVLMRLGVLAQMAGQDAEAQAWYEKLLAQNPGFIPARNNLAFLLAADPHTTGRAVTLATRAVQSDPSNGEYRDTLAVALSADGKHEEAVASAREALRLLPENAMIAVRSAKVFRDAGRTDEARELAAKAADVATPEEREAVEREVRDLLISLRGK